MDNHSEAQWRLDGVRVVRSSELDINTAQTPGMNRAAAITYARAGAEKLWAGTVVIHPKAKTGAHHHGPVESVIYVVSGLARMRWGERLEFTAEAGPGDFIYIPPFVPHQEIIRRVVIGQHCACPPRLRPARCEQGDGLRRETLPFDQSGHFLRDVSRLLFFNRSTDEKKQIFRFRTGRPRPFDGVGVDHRKRSLHRFDNRLRSPEIAPSSR